MEVDNYPPDNRPHSDDDKNSASQPKPSPPSPPPTHSPIPTNPIPDSVRGAPEELKPAIRKKQNKESARRSRRRRKQLVHNLSTSVAMLVEKTQELEARLDAMERHLSKTGFEGFAQPRLQYPVLPRSRPSSDAGPSHSGSLVLGSDGSQNRAHAPPHSHPAHPPPHPELADEDVEKLIASCLEQL